MTSQSLAAPAEDLGLANVYVWEWPVRVCHWLIAGSIWVLSITGIYMANPMLTAPGEASEHFIMGTAKLIHFYTAIVFTLSVLSRILWMFVGNKYARWDKFLPVTLTLARDVGPVRLTAFGTSTVLESGIVDGDPIAGLQPPPP